jgi:hypothetical protein
MMPFTSFSQTVPTVSSRLPWVILSGLTVAVAVDCFSCLSASEQLRAAALVDLPGAAGGDLARLLVELELGHELDDVGLVELLARRRFARLLRRRLDHRLELLVVDDGLVDLDLRLVRHGGSPLSKSRSRAAR